jgi:hypothetical protein
MLAACSGRDAVQPITETRTVEGMRRPADPSVTSAQRFGFEPMTQPAPSPMPMPTPEAAAPALEWDVPDGWRLAPDRPMRLVTYTMGATGETECYVSVFADSAGGLEANINRWLAQLGREPLTAAAIADLPAIEILGRQCPLVQATGAYTGMMGFAKPGYALLGAVCLLPEGGSIFVKMIGPEAEVLAEVDRFAAFCKSLRPAEGPSP